MLLGIGQEKNKNGSLGKKLGNIFLLKFKFFFQQIHSMETVILPMSAPAAFETAVTLKK